MSLIKEQLWLSEFPDLPMPENCSYEMFIAACRVKHDAELEELALVDYKLKKRFKELGVDYE